MGYHSGCDPVPTPVPTSVPTPVPTSVPTPAPGGCNDFIMEKTNHAWRVVGALLLKHVSKYDVTKYDRAGKARLKI